MKKIISVCLCVLFAWLIFIPASAEDITEQKGQEIINISNPQFLTFDEHKNEIQESKLVNLKDVTINNITVSFVENYAILNSNVTGKMRLKLYKSACSLVNCDSYIGILEQAENADYAIANFRIETKASRLTLTEENWEYENEPVLYLAFWDKLEGKIYYLQEKLDLAILENLPYQIASKSTDLSSEALEQKEVDYLTLNVHGIPSFTVDSSAFQEDAVTVTTAGGTETVYNDPNDISTYAADVVPGIPNSAYTITALDQWQDVFYGWSQEHGYALYAQMLTGTKNRIIYALPYLISRTKNPGTGDRDHQVYFKLNHNCLVAYTAASGELSAKEGTAAKCQTTMWARASNDKGVIYSRKQSAVLSASRITQAVKVIVFSIKSFNIGTGIETLTEYFNDPADEWNVWARNYANQLTNGEIKKAYQFIQPNLKRAEDRAWLGIKTNEATQFDIGCTRIFSF